MAGLGRRGNPSLLEALAYDDKKVPGLLGVLNAFDMKLHVHPQTQQLVCYAGIPETAY